MFRFRCVRAFGRSKLVWLFAIPAVSQLACTDTDRHAIPSDELGAGAAAGSGGTEPSETARGGSSNPGVAGGSRDTARSGSDATQQVAVPRGEPPAERCWQLPVVDRARVLPASGRAADLVGGKIVGSVSSPTNGFVDLAEIAAAPPEGEWLELPLENTTAYRYVKYYGPAGSHGVIAELELFAGEQRLEGAAFGSAGSLDDGGAVFDHALDGDASTWFEGPLPSDNYVGLDLGAGHALVAPAFSAAAGRVAGGDPITLTAEPGATIWYSVDGSDPATNGVPYAGPITLAPGNTLIKAVAVGHCALPSPVSSATFSTGGASDVRGGPATPSVQSSLHIGNSLTDTINGILPALAADGGIALDFNRYTIPGAGTWLYDQNPTGGFGLPNVQEALRTRAFDHVSMQPFPNNPCQAGPSSDGDDSDSGYIAQAWADAMTQNPNVQIWVYQQWPAPERFANCISGGVWTRGDWAPPAPADWEAAVANELSYQELVRSELIALRPDAPSPFIVPGGLGLVALKHAIDAGQVPGFNDFFGRLFQAGGTDLHMTPAGAYFIALVFYGSLFQQSPEGLVNQSGGELSDEQAAVFQRIAWETVQSYPFSGVDR